MADDPSLPPETALVDALRALGGEPGVSPDWVRFREALLRAQREAVGALRAAPSPSSLAGWMERLVTQVAVAAPGRPGRPNRPSRPGGFADLGRAARRDPRLLPDLLARCREDRDGAELEDPAERG
ncbi:MAG: hypothetical protein ACC662_10345, partial [Planctomycetota bacterium]